MLWHGGNIRKMPLHWLIYKILLHAEKKREKERTILDIDHGDMPNLTMFLVRTHCLVVKQQWDHLHLLPYIHTNMHWYCNALIPSNFWANSPYQHKGCDCHIIRFLHLWWPYQSHPLSNSIPSATQLPARCTKLVSNSETGEWEVSAFYFHEKWNNNVIELIN